MFTSHLLREPCPLLPNVPSTYEGVHLLMCPWACSLYRFYYSPKLINMPCPKSLKKKKWLLFHQPLEVGGIPALTKPRKHQADLSWARTTATGHSPSMCHHLFCVAPVHRSVSLGRVLKKRQHRKTTICPLQLSEKPNSLSRKALNMLTKYLAVGYDHFLLTSLRWVAWIFSSHYLPQGMEVIKESNQHSDRSL